MHLTPINKVDYLTCIRKTGGPKAIMYLKLWCSLVFYILGRHSVYSFPDTWIQSKKYKASSVN